MKKFLVLYHMPEEAMKAGMSKMTPEETKAGMAQWMAWAENCGDRLVDLGAPLAGGQKLTSSGSSPSEKEVAGYSILQAESMDAAKKLLDSHPHFAYSGSCTIEIHEAFPIPGAEG